MKFLTVPKGIGIWSSIYLLLGISLTIGSGIFWILNVLFSAFGLMGFTGAEMKMNDVDILFSFIPIISNGGRIGLILAFLGGLIASAVESIVWLSPKENKTHGSNTTIDQKNLFIWFSIIILIYDVLSTHYFLMGSTFIDFSHGLTWGEKIINGILSFIAVFGITIILFSIGSELFLIYGIELVINNYKDGFINIQTAIYTIFGINGNIDDSMDKIKSDRNNIENKIERRGRKKKERPFVNLEKQRLQERVFEINNRKNKREDYNGGGDIIYPDFLGEEAFQFNNERKLIDG